MKKLVPFCLIILLTSCFSTETKNPIKAYEYWARSKPPKEIKLIKGEYYQSPHFTLEYELFLKLKSDKKWFAEFVVNNELEIDTIKHDWSRFTELPDWFRPDNNCLVYTRDQNDEFERSRYIINPKTRICYIYETLGM